MGNWFFESHKGFKYGYKINKVLYDKKSKFQRVRIAQTESHGRIMILDDIVMLTERFEFIYHEMMAHIPLFIHPGAENVLIIGGGDGGTLREVLKHRSVENVDMVEIDEKVLESSRIYLQSISSQFHNKRANIIVGDGIEFVKNKKEVYDIIMLDSSDPVGPAEGLFTAEFFCNCYRILKKDGIFIGQSESPFYLKEYFKNFYKRLKRIFPLTRPALTCIPDYPLSFWSFLYASKKYDPVKHFVKKRYRESRIKTQYYNEDIHLATFSMPNFAKDLLK
ncbi:MAG: polyamine aminopropyltransferase [Spirochaetes bacterium]|nr:polyamine aminopropyltransferase [Spirochaetota bacterium]